MTTNFALAHNTVSKRSRQIPLFCILMWGAGLVSTVLGMAMTGSPWFLLSVPVSVLIGFPTKDNGPLPLHLYRKRQQRKDRNEKYGILRTPPHGKMARNDKNLTKLEKPQAVTAKTSVNTRQGPVVRDLSLLSDPDGEYVTAALTLNGASHEWLESDPDGKMSWDTAWQGAMIRALSTTSNPDLHLCMVTACNPSNKEPDYEWAKRRASEPAMLAALDAERGGTDHDKVDATIGSFIHETTDTAHASGGEMRYWVLLRMPWPTSFGRRANLADPEVVRRSDIMRTVTKVIGAYKENGIDCEIADINGIDLHWRHLLGLQDLAALRMYSANGTLQPNKLTRPESIIDLGRTIAVNGTFITAGYVDAYTKESLEPGFQLNSLIVEPGIPYVTMTWIFAPLMSTSKIGAREKERSIRVLSGLLPTDQGVTDIEGNKALADIIQQREFLAAEGGLRAAQWYNLVLTKGSTKDECEVNWDDITASMAGYYQLMRCSTADDIMDVILAGIGMKIE